MKIVTIVVAAVLLLAGCSSSDSDAGSDPAPAASESTAAPSAPTSATPTDEPSDTTSVVVKIIIADGKVTPQGDRVDVKVGQKVLLSVTSDVDEEIHVHSEPEHSYEVAAGTSISESFTIDTPGQVAVEAHGLDVTIVQLVVRP